MLITNSSIITWEFPNRILENHAVRIQDGIIAEISPQAELLFNYPDEERIDAHGQYLLPGNICAHTHFYGAFSRGLSIRNQLLKNSLQY
jgi:cytosine/adenosine deaminase-related metal-dependent hydrolase